MTAGARHMSAGDRGVTSPALLYGERFDVTRCGEECAAALAVADEMRRANPDLPGWLNFPLVNQSGRAEDVMLVTADRDGRDTSHAAHFPYCMEIVATLRRALLVVTYARLAVLPERAVFAPHRDVYDSLRFIIPLNEHGTDFRHVAGSQCFSMRAGELWLIDGQSFHGAANVGREDRRVALLVDVRSDATLSGLGEGRPIPADHACTRPRWTAGTRSAVFSDLLSAAETSSFGDVKRELLMIPFLYELDAESVNAEIVAFCDFVAAEAALRELRDRYAVCARELADSALPLPPPAH